MAALKRKPEISMREAGFALEVAEPGDLLLSRKAEY
jgi:hypothetical protein